MALSYRIWAKQPTSEIMWINTILNHSSITTSISYNVFALTSIIKVTDRISVETELNEQQSRIDRISEKMEAILEDLKTQVPVVANIADVAVSDRSRSPQFAYVKLVEGKHDYREIRKQPIKRQGQQEKVERLKAVVEQWKEEGIATTSTNFRAVGFSDKTIKALRLLAQN